MKLIVTALCAEAAPIIKYLQLQRIPDTPFSLFTNDTHMLVCTEPGIPNAATAVAFVLTRYQKITSVINIGICAASPMQAKIGKCFTVSKLIDRATHRLFYCKSKNVHFPKATLTCVTQPLSEKEMRHEKGLVDMESTGIYIAAKRFLPRERIGFYKIVSDYGTDKIPDPQFVSELIAKNLPLLEKILTTG